jgi:hypothetical protein
MEMEINQDTNINIKDGVIIIVSQNYSIKCDTNRVLYIKKNTDSIYKSFDKLDISLKRNNKILILMKILDELEKNNNTKEEQQDVDENVVEEE